MYILSNIQNRNYREIYPDIEDVIFDITDTELKNKRNKDWHGIKEGSLVCVILASKKVSTFYKVNAIMDVSLLDEENGNSHILTGEVVAKSSDREDVTMLLQKFSVQHQSLPNNKIGAGFKVADISGSLDELEITTADGEIKALGLL